MRMRAAVLAAAGVVAVACGAGCAPAGGPASAPVSAGTAIASGTAHAPGTPGTSAPAGAGASPAADGAGRERAVYAIDFADARHGYALRSSCTGGERYRCDTDVIATEDGGRTWARRASPVGEVRAPDGLSAGLHVLGRDRVVVEDRGRRWFSADGARRWKDADRPGARPVDAVPGGGVLTAVCGDQGCGRPLVLLPESGARAPLASLPALTDWRVSQGVPAADGTWWAAGRRPGSREWSLAGSRDSGRTWSVRPLPGLTGNVFGVSVSAGPSATYAVVRGELPGEQVKNGLLAIYRSADGGRTWERTWRHRPGVAPLSSLGAGIAAADGRLMIAGEDRRVHTSRDGGRSFTASGPADVAGWVSWTRAGYLNQDGDRLRLSADGLTWRDIA
ncbi:WD40/YVTN/BNR-like repeat-containing protein [Bailinhaonella thermotolerans]|uniref:Exo-alpha-sialidase n=1 Tax=Bailinhaonella thermotolerans TaxID=1070861 RepID=A0A3A4A686_9ACTN|nr:hypothetical protein [Bailinhaonella thermotolerans]RJL24416.1 hypothetical protein D5H75_29195 [Bailinhaonella thermotolerans]